jgi:hypothetical protein
MSKKVLRCNVCKKKLTGLPLPSRTDNWKLCNKCFVKIYNKAVDRTMNKLPRVN